jgi:hypothetical protein
MKKKQGSKISCYCPFKKGSVKSAVSEKSYCKTEILKAATNV